MDQTPSNASILDWADLCVQQVVWNSRTGRNEYGAPIYAGPSQTFMGRRAFKYTRVSAYERGTKGQGAENISESQIWILGTPNVQYEDQILIAGDFAPQWASGTAYALNATVLDSSSHIQQCVVAGTSGANPPTWNDNEGTTTDGGVTWQDTGPAPVPPILSVMQLPDDEGPLFVKIYLGSSNG